MMITRSEVIQADSRLSIDGCQAHLLRRLSDAPLSISLTWLGGLCYLIGRPEAARDVPP
jgi:hypothetical protein